MDDPRRSVNILKRISVKKGLVGLVSAGPGMNQKMGLTPRAKELLTSAVDACGCVKIVIDSDTFVGTNVDTTKMKTWGEKLDHIVRYLKVDEPSFFALFRSNRDCLIVSFSPDEAAVRFKMQYAASKDSLKDYILEIDENISLEEFNVTSPADLSYAAYESKRNAPRPYTEQELLRMEEEKADKGGNYGILARLMAAQRGETDNRDVLRGDENAKPIALPGMGGPMGMNMLELRGKLKKTNQGAPAQRKESNSQGQISQRKESNSQNQIVHFRPSPKPNVNKSSSGAVPLIIPASSSINKSQELAQPPPVPARIDTNTMATEVDIAEDDQPIMETTEEDLDLLAPTPLAKPSLMNESAKVIIKEATEAFSSPARDDGSDDDASESEDEDRDQAELEKSQAQEMRALAESSKPVIRQGSAEDMLLEKPVEDMNELPKSPSSFQIENAEYGNPMDGAPEVPQMNKMKSRASSFVQGASRLGRKGKEGVGSASTRFINGVRGFFKRNKNRGLPVAQLDGLRADDGEATYEELKVALTTGEFMDFDSNKLESYLSSRDFAIVFGITKEAFYALNGWDQNKKKRAVGLL